MRIFLATMVLFLASFGALAYEEAGEWQTVFVPEGKKVYIADKKMPKTVLSVKGWKLEKPVAPVEITEIPEECKDYGQLVISPSYSPAYCSQYFPD
jgi:hypothetical protein